MPGISVCAVDVGSLANIGWWRVPVGDEPTAGCDLDSLVDAVANDLIAGRGVALGFEAPLFIPVPADHGGLNLQRAGDRGRPWSAGAGPIALALGLQHAAYVFKKLAEVVHPVITFDPEGLRSGKANLLVWEAFVSGHSKNRAAEDPHVDDSRLAVNEFTRRYSTGLVESDVDEPVVLSLVAAGLLASGLTTDLSLLHQSCVVVAPPAQLPWK